MNRYSRFNAGDASFANSDAMGQVYPLFRYVEEDYVLNRKFEVECVPAGLRLGEI